MAKLLLKQEDPNNAGQFLFTGNPLNDKDCGKTIHVQFVDDNGTPLTLVEGVATANSAEHGSPTWAIYGPDAILTAADEIVLVPGNGGQNGSTNPQTFVPTLPGKYLVTLTTTPATGTPGKHTALYEVPDPQVPKGAIPAPNERDEYDADEGWARGIERFLAAVSGTMSRKELVTVRNSTAGTFAAGQLVTFGSHDQDADLSKWRGATADALHYRNYVIEARQTIGGTPLNSSQSAPWAYCDIGLVLRDIPPGETGQILLRGVINYDTTGLAASQYLLLAANSPELSATGGVNTRPLAIVHNIGSASDASPGSIYYDGTGASMPSAVVSNVAQIAALQQLKVAKFTPTTPAAPHSQAVSDGDPWLWANPSDNDHLYYGTKKLATHPLVQSHVQVVWADVSGNDPAGSYTVTGTDALISVDTSGNPAGTPTSVRIPHANSVPVGRTYTIKDNAGSLEAGKPIQVYPYTAGADIDNKYTATNPLELLINWSSVSLYSDGTRWLIY